MEANEEIKPSFYEIMIQDRLHTMLYNSLKFIASTISEKYTVLTSLRYYTEEIASLFSGLLDLYFLMKTKGTFTENYYSIATSKE